MKQHARWCKWVCDDVRVHMTVKVRAWWKCVYRLVKAYVTMYDAERVCMTDNVCIVPSVHMWDDENACGGVRSHVHIKVHIWCWKDRHVWLGKSNYDGEGACMMVKGHVSGWKGIYSNEYACVMTSAHKWWWNWTHVGERAYRMM